MFGAIFESVISPWWRHIDRGLASGLRQLQRSARKIGIGVTLLQLARPFFVLAISLFLAALFLTLGHLGGWVMPAVWTGLATLASALVIFIAGCIVLA